MPGPHRATPSRTRPRSCRSTGTGSPLGEEPAAGTGAMPVRRQGRASARGHGAGGQGGLGQGQVVDVRVLAVQAAGAGAVRQGQGQGPAGAARFRGSPEHARGWRRLEAVVLRFMVKSGDFLPCHRLPGSQKLSSRIPGPSGRREAGRRMVAHGRYAVPADSTYVHYGRYVEAGPHQNVPRCPGYGSCALASLS